jgi:hypothetical protein
MSCSCIGHWCGPDKSICFDDVEGNLNQRSRVDEFSRSPGSNSQCRSPNRMKVSEAMLSRSRSGYGMNRQDEMNVDYKDEEECLEI